MPLSGKSTIARELPALLLSRGLRTVVLDQEDVEKHLGPDLPLQEDAPALLARRVAFLADILVRNGLVPIVALWSPLCSTRARARLRIRQFVEVYVSTPAPVCRMRHPIGSASLGSAQAHEKRVDDAAGVFEPPGSPDITVATLDRTSRQAAEWVVRELDRTGWTRALTVGAWSYTAPPEGAEPAPVKAKRRSVAKSRSKGGERTVGQVKE